MSDRVRRLRSERVVVNAPMSFVGAARRAWRLTHLADRIDVAPVRWTVIALLALPALALTAIWWAAVAGWYVIFGLLVVPYSAAAARKPQAQDRGPAAP